MRIYHSFRELINTRTLRRRHGGQKPFGRDIVTPTYEATSVDERFYDLRLAWNQELCSITSVKTSQEFKDVLHRWVEDNPFMYGINWMNTMEVARRAVNIIKMYRMFAVDGDDSFRSLVDRTLLDHLKYIRCFPEIFTHPNNHYIADLVGHLALAKYFGYQREIDGVEKKLDREFERQILSDGTSYEGSTSYHRLLTEMYGYYLSIKSAPTLSDRTKLHAMTTFLTRCTPPGHHLLKIGDDDGTPLVSPYPYTIQDAIPFDEQMIYPEFGLGIIMHRPWHLTLRHATYRKSQPTGHFHNDELSVTATYGKIPLLVDPGTGLYTGNTFLRNTLRHASSHTTFYATTPIKYDSLFVTPRHQQSCSTIPNQASLETDLLSQTRKLTVDPETGILGISDSWKSLRPTSITWNFILHPSIDISQVAPNNIELTHTDHKFTIRSTLPLAINRSIYSPTYGATESCYKISATTNQATGTALTTIQP